MSQREQSDKKHCSHFPACGCDDGALSPDCWPQAAQEESLKLDRDWWRAQGIEACLDRMQLMGDRLAAPVSVPSSTAIVPPSWVAFSKAAGETSEGVMRRALGDIASISPLSTAAPQEIARNALIAAEALATPVSAIERETEEKADGKA